VGAQGPSPRTVQVPKGIDPGWGYQVGRSASADVVGDGAPLLGKQPLFHRFLEEAGPGPSFPVAALDDSRIVLLSGETAAKQRRNHPDIGAADYAMVQQILDDGEMFAEPGGRFVRGFIDDEDGRLWKTVVKMTADDAGTYLVTLHRAKERDLRASRQRLERIGME